MRAYKYESDIKNSIQSYKCSAAAAATTDDGTGSKQKSILTIFIPMFPLP